MSKGTLVAAAGFLSLCLPLFGQTQQTSVLVLRTSSAGFQQLALADGRPFSFARAPVWTQSEAPVTLPMILVTGPQTAAYNKATTDGKDSSKEIQDSKEVAELTRADSTYVHGEVGAMFGVSTGKFARDFESGYITGTVGNDKFQISAGGSYENWNQHFPRSGR